MNNPKDFTLDMVNDGTGANLKIEWGDIGGKLDSGLKIAQYFVDTELLTQSLPYMPHDSGDFQRRTEIENKPYAGTGIVLYPGPTARFLYHGVLMVGVESGSAWAWDGESKVIATGMGAGGETLNVALDYKGAPKRGRMWAERTWEDHKENIIDGAQKAMDGGLK